MPIREWDDIKDAYAGGCLVMGNGASIAMHPGFGYTTLRREAAERGYLAAADPVFDSFQTVDFELVLRLLWQAERVNGLLEVDAPVVKQAYERVRDALIQTVRATHIEYGDLRENPFLDQDAQRLPTKHRFLNHFQLVFSLNYDLLVYWARMVQSQSSRDGFKATEEGLVFDGLPDRLEVGTSYVLYPHGNLCLVRNQIGDERKIRAGSGVLLERALESWQSSEAIPLFVSEGTSAQKMKAIRSSAYLSAAYAAFRKPTTSASLVIYGWGMGDQDAHITDALKGREATRIAVSVHQATAEQQQDLVTRIEREFDVTPDLFAAHSVGAWAGRPAQA